jgi:hypothetical protein
VSSATTFAHPDITSLSTHLLDELGLAVGVGSPAEPKVQEPTAEVIEFEDDDELLRFIDTKFEVEE